MNVGQKGVTAQIASSAEDDRSGKGGVGALVFYFSSRLVFKSRNCPTTLEDSKVPYNGA